MVGSREILDIVEIVFFAPALPLSIYICVKHGFKREAGWFLLLVLSLIRIVGAACGIAASKNDDTTLLTISLILSSVGSATLVAAFTGITNRIAEGSKGSPFSAQQRKLLQIIGIVSIVLGIVAGTKIGDSDPSTRSTGVTYLKVAVILILVQFSASCVVLGFCAMNFRHILDVDRKLFFCVSLAVPFLLVRVIYSVLSAFDFGSSTFSMLSTSITAIVVRACLGIAMEIITVYLFILAGIVSPKMITGQRSSEAEVLTQQNGQVKSEYSAPPAYKRGTTTS